MTNAALETALDVADRLGWFVFPVTKDRKAPPLLPNGRNGASNDVAQIARWGAEFPGANFAVATGLESGAGVVDLDGEDGENWWDSHWFEHGADVQTPSGGRHTYYALTDETEYKSSVKEMHHEVDTRFEGGYALLPGCHTIEIIDPETGKHVQYEGTYEGDLSEIPDLPTPVAEILPVRYYRPEGEKVYLDVSSKPKTASVGEQRVMANIKQMLDDLPRPWRKGAGYHDVTFRVACWLWGIIQSPEYALTERQAEEFFFDNSPRRHQGPEGEEILRKRWEGARGKTEGHPADPPGDVPPLLDPNSILVDVDAYPEVDRLYWEITSRKDLDLLIRECRRAGLTEQQAYSLASASKANKLPNGQRATSQWGRTKRIYNEIITDAELEVLDNEHDVVKVDPEAERQKIVDKSLRGKFLSPAEREAVDKVPNFIDLYVEVAKTIYKEPNLPLAYLNAWAVLSALGSEYGYVGLEQGRRPLNLYCLLMSDSGSGKGDMKEMMDGVLEAYGEGIGALAPFGRKPTAEAIEKILVDRNGKSALLRVDEASELLRAFHNPKGSYMSGVMDMILDVYDGKVTRSARVGHEEEDRGASVIANFSVWLQATYLGVTEELTEADIQTGLIGRFIPAIGWAPNFTPESLKLRYADDYQDVMRGQNPLTNALGNELVQAFSTLPPGGVVAVKPANREAGDRLDRFRVDIDSYVRRLPMHRELQPICARLGINVLKAACLIALSNGRARYEMPDVLVAIKSGEQWLTSMLQLAEAIVSGDLRKKITRLVELIEARPLTRAQIATKKYFDNLDLAELDRLLQRAVIEGRIEEDGNTYKIRKRTKA